MKKGLLLLVVVAFIAVTMGAAFAGPFSDVPKKHWAYDAVNTLSSKGLLEGYSDGKFKGNKAMTRYEMALVVARLLDKKFGGADLETLQKLTIEFADELALLGVKVQALEEEVKVIRNDMDAVKADVDQMKKGGFGKIKLNFEDRIRFEENKYKSLNTTVNNVAGAATVVSPNNSTMYNRLRMNVKGNVDENVTFFTSLQYTTRHGLNGVQNNPANQGFGSANDTTTDLFLGYVDIKNFGGKVIDNLRVGRQTMTIGKGFTFDNEVDGITVKKAYRGTNFTLGAYDMRSTTFNSISGAMATLLAQTNYTNALNTYAGAQTVANYNALVVAQNALIASQNASLNNDGLNAKYFAVDHAWKNVAAGAYYLTQNDTAFALNGNPARVAGVYAPAAGAAGDMLTQTRGPKFDMFGLTLDGKIGKSVVAFVEYADQKVKDKEYFSVVKNLDGVAANNDYSWKGKGFKLGAEWTINNRWDLTGLYQQREKDFRVLGINDDYSDSVYYGNGPFSTAYSKNAMIFANPGTDNYNNSKIMSAIVGYKATDKLHLDVWYEDFKGKDNVNNSGAAVINGVAVRTGMTNNFDQNAIQLISTYQYKENTAFKLRYRTVKYKSGDSDYQVLGAGAPADYDQVRLDLNVKF